MGFWEKGTGLFRKGVASLEDSKAGFFQLGLTFLFAVALRNFLEHFSAGSKLSAELILHYSLFYCSLALFLIVLFWLATGEKVKKIARVVMPCFLLLAVAPIVDLVLTFGTGAKTGYIIPGIHKNLAARFFAFTGSFSGFGVTAGIKAEVALVLVLAFGYFWLKNEGLGKWKCLTKSLFFSFLLYCQIFFYGAILFPAEWVLKNLGLAYENIGIPVSHFYLATIFFGGILVAWLANKRKFKAVLGEMPFLRLLHFELMLALGIAFGLAGNHVFRLEAMHVCWLATTAIAIALGLVYAMFSNNLADLEADRKGGKKSAVAMGKVGLEQYRKAGFLFLAASLFYALIVNFQAFFIILVFVGNYFLYSMPPLRLKRIPVLSKALISLNSLALAMLGFLLVRGSLLDFPAELFPIFLIGFTLALNFIDLKDFASDKRAGIRTLPVLLGLKKAKTVVGLFFIVAYVSFTSIIAEFWAFPLLLLLGLAQFALIKRKNYRERPVLALYLLSMASLTLYLLAMPK